VTLRSNDVIDSLVSHAASLGHFERVNTVEPKSAPGNGLYCFIFLDRMSSAPSGLASMSITMTFTVSLRTPMMSAYSDDLIDPQMMLALDDLMTAYANDFQLDGTVRSVDLSAVRVQAGYIEQDSKVYRAIDITLPVVVNDVWDEAP
jgi:hypothetical protein